MSTAASTTNQTPPNPPPGFWVHLSGASFQRRRNTAGKQLQKNAFPAQFPCLSSPTPREQATKTLATVSLFSTTPNKTSLRKGPSGSSEQNPTQKKRFHLRRRRRSKDRKAQRRHRRSDTASLPGPSRSRLHSPHPHRKTHTSAASSENERKRKEKSCQRSLAAVQEATMRRTGCATRGWGEGAP